MKYEVCIKYPAGFRYRKEIEADTLDDANREAEKIRKERDKGFKNPDDGPVCKVEYVRPSDQTRCPTCGKRY